MEPETKEISPDVSPYMDATSPNWIGYYKRAKATRRLGRGQHAAIQRATKRRRRQANLVVLGTTALLLAVVAAFCAILGTDYAKPTGEGSRRIELRPADARRG
jgi:hypothetical protein